MDGNLATAMFGAIGIGFTSGAAAFKVYFDFQSKRLEGDVSMSKTLLEKIEKMETRFDLKMDEANSRIDASEESTRECEERARRLREDMENKLDVVKRDSVQLIGAMQRKLEIAEADIRQLQLQPPRRT